VIEAVALNAFISIWHRIIIVVMVIVVIVVIVSAYFKVILYISDFV
jgi:hypothetical protein